MLSAVSHTVVRRPSGATAGLITVEFNYELSYITTESLISIHPLAPLTVTRDQDPMRDGTMPCARAAVGPQRTEQEMNVLSRFCYSIQLINSPCRALVR